jgi:hypothetical protein
MGSALVGGGGGAGAGTPSGSGGGGGTPSGDGGKWERGTALKKDEAGGDEKQADPSEPWAAVEGAKRHSLSTLLDLQPSQGETLPTGLEPTLGIIHLWAEKQKEAAQFTNGGGGGQGGTPRGGGRGGRNNGPPKEYKKAGWAAGTKTDEESKVLSKARLVLNKLTVEKFDRLSDDFMAGGAEGKGSTFTSVPLLEGAIDIIVDKAQMEQHFGGMYADLCLKMARTPIEELGEEPGSKGKQFKKSLLQRCQVGMSMEVALLGMEGGRKRERGGSADVPSLFIVSD